MWEARSRLYRVTQRGQAYELKVCSQKTGHPLPALVQLRVGPPALGLLILG